MAANKSHPARTLVIFVLVVAAGLAGAISLGSWKPRLGLDLQGGTRITLQAKAQGGSVTKAAMEQAVNIIRERVNGVGVAESQVTTLGSDVIVVEIPGTENKSLVRTVSRSAQLRFRMVAMPPIGPAGTPPPTTTPSTSGTTGSTGTTGTQGTTGPTATVRTPNGSGTTTRSSRTTTSPTTGTTTANGRPAGAWMLDDGNTSAKKTTSVPTTGTPTATKGPATTGTTKGPATTGTTTTGPTTTGTPTTGPTATTPSSHRPVYPTSSDGVPAALTPPHLYHIKDPLIWKPPTELQVKLYSLKCPKGGGPAPGQLDIPSQPLLACDAQGNRYILSPAVIEGTQLTNAAPELPQSATSWLVALSFNSSASKTFLDVTRYIAGTGGQFAIVLDGLVVSAPTAQQAIAGGQATIEGNFTQQSATELANVLKFGALPLSFRLQGVEDVGPQLASNQLNAGIVAGIIGMILVVGYCMLYYRGLSVVIISSLLIAGVLTYVCVLLLGHAYGFTLTLPGIAGFIVAVGITADSFIVYFERIRDEVRDGRSLRTAVEAGWRRARTTILAADSVSFLAALVLFIFAIDVIKGFAFALGLSTLIDLFVVFLFTKPMVTLLARTTFFGQGHKLSGLDRRHLGIIARPRTTEGDA